VKFAQRDDVRDRAAGRAERKVDMQTKRTESRDDSVYNVLSGPDPSRLLASMPERFSHIVKAWAKKEPHRRALASAGREMTYGELWEATTKAAALLAKKGVRPGDRVLLIGENGFQLVPLMLAVSELDAWAALLNARMSVREVGSIREFADCRRAVYCVGDSAAADEHAKADASAGETEELLGRLVLSSLNEGAVAEPAFPEKSRQTAVLVFTSGTTAEPKGVKVSHQALIYMGANMAELRGVTPDDVFYNSSPISHTIGLGTVLMTAFCAGASVELVGRFTPQHFVEALHGERITSVTAVPTLFTRILEYAEKEGLSLRSRRLRIIATAGAPLDLALKAKVEEAFGIRMGNSYGMTECNPIARSSGGVETNEVGELQPGVEIRLVKEDGKDAGVGESGEIWARGPCLMLGYYRNDGATKAVMREGGFMATGDIAKLGEKGRLYIVGRSKELIIRSGFNVYPVEVESVLSTFPGVAQVAVVGRPVPGNEEVVAFVQPGPGCELDVSALSRWASERLAPYKRPAEIIVKPELPIGPTGKVFKIRLRELAAKTTRE
jgi:acyl-CoA synthetase (AMP-forming)/AMP-acid ligase II